MGCINSTNKTLFTIKRDDIFRVSVVKVQSNQSLALPRHGILEITPQELTFTASEQEPISWALQHLRRYGLTGNVFSFEAGRRCPNGPGIYTFRCCNADQFYVKFQRCITSMSLLGDRSNSLINSAQLNGRLGSYHQPNTNHYLEPTLVQVTLDTPTIAPDSFTNDMNEINFSSSLTAEIIHFPSVPPYSNITPNSESSGNIYIEQPRRSNEHNNFSENELIGSAKANHKPILKDLLRSSFDVPPDEIAPILNVDAFETEKLYENVESNRVVVGRSTSSCQNTYTSNNSTQRFYANVEFLPSIEPHIEQQKSLNLEHAVEPQQPVVANTQIVNYIILDLEQPRSPSQVSPINEFGSGQSLPGSRGNVSSLSKVDQHPSETAISYTPSTMPKNYTIINKSSKPKSNEIECSGSYTRIDFLKTFALMKSSVDFDVENEQEESRITRHSKFVRKSYSISE